MFAVLKSESRSTQVEALICVITIDRNQGKSESIVPESEKGK